MRLHSVRMVRPMISRMSAAGLASALSLGLMLASTETFGRGGGFGGRSFSPSQGAHMHGFRAPGHVFAHVARWRRQFGFGVPLFAPGAFLHGYGTFVNGYDAPGFLPPVAPPPYVEPEVTTGIIPGGPAVYGGAYPFPIHRRGCQTETVTVPLEDSENKGEVESSINIVRC